MRITSGGNVGIGTTAPSVKLTVSNAANGNIAGFTNTVDADLLINLTSGVSLISPSSGILAFGTSSTERMRITSGGDVLVNATATTQGAKFYVNGIGAFGSVYVGALGTGTVYSNAGFLTNTNPSDYRLKNTIKPLTYGLNEVMKLNPKSFYYNDNATNLKYGFIAQEVKEVMPELARKLDENSDYLGLETEGIFVTLVNAVKELKAELDLIKNK
jgi:hypothetical protein